MIGADAAGNSELTEKDIELAYRFFLGRPPENKDVVATHLKLAPTIEKLRETFLKSPEFRLKAEKYLNLPRTKPLDWPKTRVETFVPESELKALLDHVEGNWSILGETEPHYSVLSSDDFKAASIGEQYEKFYESGKGTVTLLERAAERSGVNLGDLDTCFELGCGVGRVSIWLAQRFKNVVAADISRPHLKIADDELRKRGITNVRTTHINSIARIGEVAPFDCFFSVIVLQHNPPPVIAHILKVILAKLRPGGIAYFQVPTYLRGREFSTSAYLAAASVNGEMEMHSIPQAELWRIVADAGCSLLEVREDGWSGMPEIISNSVLLKKAP